MMRDRKIHSAIFCVLALSAWLWARPARAIVLGQIDDFQTGTMTLGWNQGAASPNPPGVDPDGGPNGAGDAYLAVSSAGGGGAGSKMVVFNTDPHWLGNYSLAGVSRITFDIQNRSFTTPMMRIGIKGGTFGTLFVSTSASPLPDDGGLWHPFAFDLTATGMTNVGGSETLSQVLANVTELRILSAQNPSFTGDSLAAAIGLDNIRATSVPEPTSIACLLGVVAVCTLSRYSGRGAR